MVPKLALSSFLTLFLLFLSLSSAPRPVSSARCIKDDKKALVAIKAAFNNAYHFASWTNDTGCCDWYDVDCDLKTDRVIGLSLFQDDFLGTISDAVGDLPYLQNLMFHYLPNLIGPIPQALTKLKNLRFLDISWTNVSAPSPPSFPSSPPSINSTSPSTASPAPSRPPLMTSPPSTPSMSAATTSPGSSHPHYSRAPHSGHISVSLTTI